MYWEYHPGREPQADEGYMYQTTCAVVVVAVVEMEFAGVGKHSYAAVNKEELSTQIASQ